MSLESQKRIMPRRLLQHLVRRVAFAMPTKPSHQRPVPTQSNNLRRRGDTETPIREDERLDDLQECQSEEAHRSECGPQESSSPTGGIVARQRLLSCGRT